MPEVFELVSVPLEEAVPPAPLLLVLSSRKSDAPPAHPPAKRSNANGKIWANNSNLFILCCSFKIYMYIQFLSHVCSHRHRRLLSGINRICRKHFAYSA